MAVFRVEKNNGYTVMSNHHLRNKDLSLKAKGLLSQMLSLPEDWDYTLKGLAFINREQIDAIREAVRELEKAGYIVRSRERDEKGRLRVTDYVIYETPQPASDLPTLENPTLGNPTQDNPTLEKPTLENPTQLNKDIQRTDLDYYAVDGGTEFGEGSSPGHREIPSSLSSLWLRGSFASVYNSLNYHYSVHGAEVGSTNIVDYATKAATYRTAVVSDIATLTSTDLNNKYIITVSSGTTAAHKYKHKTNLQFAILSDSGYYIVSYGK